MASDGPELGHPPPQSPDPTLGRTSNPQLSPRHSSRYSTRSSAKIVISQAALRRASAIKRVGLPFLNSKVIVHGGSGLRSTRRRRRRAWSLWFATPQGFYSAGDNQLKSRKAVQSLFARSGVVLSDAEMFLKTFAAWLTSIQTLQEARGLIR